ncbi:immunoglobulin-like domain-containing protein, partial [Patescibacteria group bacterium]
GWVSWVDLPVSSSAASGDSQAFSAQIDNNEILTVYSQADGSGGINDVRVVVGTSTSAILGNSNIPYGSLMVADGALCVDSGSGSTCDDQALSTGQLFTSNGALFMGGNVGIGTTSPYAKLSVAGDVVITDHLTTSYFIGTSTATSTFAGGVDLLALNITGSATSTAANGINLTAGCFSVNGTCVQDSISFKWTDNGSYLTTTGGEFIDVAHIVATSTTATSTFAGGLVVETSGLVYDYSTNNVGIGTASPSMRLSVTGDTLLDSTLIRFASTSASTLTVDYAAAATSTIVDSQLFSWTIATSTTATPIFRIDTSGTGAEGVATSTFTGGLSVGGGALEYDYSSGITSIGSLQIGATNFEENAGMVSWVDMPVTSAAPVGTVERYSAQIDNNSLLTIYAESDGAGGIQNSGIGIGTTSPTTLLTVGSSTPTALLASDHYNSAYISGALEVGGASATSTFAGGLVVDGGAFTHDFGSNITSIENLEVGPMAFDNDAGKVSWINMPISTTTAAGTVESYTAQIDSLEILTVYSQADGNGGLNDVRVVIGTSTDAVLGSSNIPYGSLIVADGIICVDDGGASNCDDAQRFAGGLYATSSTVTAVDLAENYPTKDKTLLAGEIVMLDPENPVFVKRYDTSDTSSTTRKTLIGAISTYPGVLLGGFANEQFVDEKKVPVALSGRIPIKVTNENGAIAIGDRIAPSATIPGAGMKANGYSNTIGIALEAFDDVDGMILVFIDLASQMLSSEVASDTYAIAELDGAGESAYWNMEPSGRIKYIAPIDMNGFSIYDVKQIVGSMGKWRIDANGILVAEEVQTNKLCVGTTCVDENTLKALLQNAGLGGVDATASVIDTTPLESTDSANPDSNGAGDNATSTVSTSDTSTATTTATTTPASTATTTPELIQDPAPESDTVAPVISLIGEVTVEITEGDTYVDSGATALDETDGDISTQIVVGGDVVDVNTAGTYTITYNVSDAAENAAAEVSRTVTVVAVPEPDLVIDNATTTDATN